MKNIIHTLSIIFVIIIFISCNTSTSNENETNKESYPNPEAQMNNDAAPMTLDRSAKIFENLKKMDEDKIRNHVLTQDEKDKLEIHSFGKKSKSFAEAMRMTDVGVAYETKEIPEQYKYDEEFKMEVEEYGKILEKRKEIYRQKVRKRARAKWADD